MISNWDEYLESHRQNFCAPGKDLATGKIASGWNKVTCQASMGEQKIRLVHYLDSYLGWFDHLWGRGCVFAGVREEAL